MNLKLIGIGTSVGIVLPKSITERLHLKKGDKVYINDTPNGVELTPYDPEVAEQMEIAEKIMHERRNVLNKLAK
jgi:putative addiction module antidote